MTPKSSNVDNYLDPQERYSQQSHSQTRYQKHTQIVKKHHILTKSATVVEKMATLSQDVLSDKPSNIIKSILNPDTNMMLNLNLLHRKCLKISSELFRTHRTNVP